jgi:phosphoheptose isomerase
LKQFILLKDNSSTTSVGFDSAVDAVARKTVEKFKESYYGRYHVTLNDTSGTAREIIKIRNK